MRYQRSINRITPILGAVKLVEIDPRHVERLLRVLIEKKETAATVRMVFEDFRCALRSARRLKLITREATTDVEPPKRLGATGASCSLTDDQARDLMSAAEKTRNTARCGCWLSVPVSAVVSCWPCDGRPSTSRLQSRVSRLACSVRRPRGAGELVRSRLLALAERSL